MCDSEDLVAASSDAVLRAKTSTVLPCQAKPKVSPLIAVAAPKIVLVKKGYQSKGHRLAVRLGTDVKFSGTGTLSVAPADQLEVYDSKGVKVALPLNIEGSKLSKGVTVYVEAKSPSLALNSTTVSLALAGGDKTIENSPAKDALTCVEVTVDLCEFKAAPGGADPAPVADKIKTGRNVHVQTTEGWAGRALLVVKQAKPATYAGNLVLKALGNKVRAFDYANEQPRASDAPRPNPLSTPNSTIGGPGLKLWIEGTKVSSKVLDTGFTLELSDLPGVEGDRANMTVVKVFLDVYERPKKAGAKPKRIADASKMTQGRGLHLQNAKTEFSRAKIAVPRVKPSSWVGDLNLEVWDAPTNSNANPKLKLFTNEPARSLEHTNPITHSANYPKEGECLWVDGVTTSTAHLDTELRLRVANAEGSGDRARFTIHELLVKEIEFQGVANIYYARIPNTGSYLLPPGAEPPTTHFTPAELRPSAGSPHWKKKPAKDPQAEQSWPAVYARRKASSVPAPTLKATFELYPKDGATTVRIMADGGATGLKTEEKDVPFNNGEANKVSFALKGLPKTVKRLDGVELEWRYDGPAHKTKHTLFVVDKKPLAANNGFGNEYLWEIFEWSCRWADGTTGTSPVVDAIWAKFNRVNRGSAHDTGLVYWKNWRAVGNFMPQDLATAIQKQDPPTWSLLRNGASCKVFDRILMNCLAAQGVPSAEIEVYPDPTQFTRALIPYECTGWNDKTTVGQGNPNAPPGWGNHWIAVAKVNGWKFYDASYGEGPFKASEPGPLNTTIDVQEFEPHSVAPYDPVAQTGGFQCSNLRTLTKVNLPRDPDPNELPHLIGEVLWTNK